MHHATQVDQCFCLTGGLLCIRCRALSQLAYRGEVFQKNAITLTSFDEIGVERKDNRLVTGDFGADV